MAEQDFRTQAKTVLQSLYKPSFAASGHYEFEHGFDPDSITV